MKISELIKELQKIKKEKGDCDCTMADFANIQAVEYCEKYKLVVIADYKNPQALILSPANQKNIEKAQNHCLQKKGNYCSIRTKSGKAKIYYFNDGKLQKIEY